MSVATINCDPIENNDNTAITRGFTRAIMIESNDGCSSFAALVEPDFDADSRYKAFDTDNQEWLYVNGWNCSNWNLDEA